MTGDEAQHAIKVLRMQVGDEMVLINGQGLRVQAHITNLSKKHLEFSPTESHQQEEPLSAFHLIIAPTKNIDRIEWCVEKCTEIGLARISFIYTQNSERRRMRIDRIQKRAIAAMKQSRSLYMPQIDEPMTFSDFLQHNRLPGLSIAHCRAGHKRYYAEQSAQLNSVLIGPEGDFTEEEIAEAMSMGAKPIHLGSKRLRTETAALVACTIANL